VFILFYFIRAEWCDAGMVIYLEQGADMHIAQLMPLPLTISCSSKSRLVLPEWFCFSGAGLPGLSWKKGRQTNMVVVVIHADGFT